jgi:hypothetical protein
MMTRIFRAIAFHYREERLPLISKLINAQRHPNFYIKTVITTNTNNPTHLDKIANSFKDHQVSLEQVFIVSFPTLAHPWLLPWAHKQIMLDAYHQDDFDLFIYTEDDILLTNSNILHWIDFNAELYNIGASSFFPSFCRIEFSTNLGDWVFTEIMKPISPTSHPSITLPKYGNQLAFFSLTDAHQAMFIYDRRQMTEYIMSDKFHIEKCPTLSYIDSPDWAGGGVAEWSSFGISRHNVPAPFHSRNLLPIFTNTGLPHPGFLVHHATDTYANYPDKLTFKNLFDFA